MSAGDLLLIVSQDQMLAVSSGQCRVLYLKPAETKDCDLTTGVERVLLRGSDDPPGLRPLRLDCRGVLNGRTRRRGPVVAVFLGARL